MLELFIWSKQKIVKICLSDLHV
ncbi:unnamed protein product [Spodoptera littoralis]|uniref:Uncharacterized protein n=1 Tax=Spodoptera littoralis TaxID=7109 RepID=A0A9P0N696_SPOLI|nr:unnamed protein product [Spodoptera littoralis]CAH1646568.1 unnamed protein product [Spodoptera littoralis]